MTVHSQHPDDNGAVFAAYSHAASNREAEWLYTHPEFMAAVAVFVLTVAFPYPMLAAVLAGLIAVTMVTVGLVLSIREGDGTCRRIIREVHEREEQS